MFETTSQFWLGTLPPQSKTLLFRRGCLCLSWKKRSPKHGLVGGMLVVYLPLWKIWVRQLRWWHSQKWKVGKFMFQTTNQYYCWLLSTYCIGWFSLNPNQSDWRKMSAQQRSFCSWEPSSLLSSIKSREAATKDKMSAAHASSLPGCAAP